MRKILNPFQGVDDYHCFACCPDNMDGLHMQFYEENGFVVCQWEQQPRFVGYKNVLHGGIQSTLLDEIAAWACYIQLNTSGMTRNLNVSFKKPVYINKGPITLKARVENYKHPLSVVKSELYDFDQILCTEASVEYFIFPFEKASKELFFPGKEKFFEPEPDE
jgi:uncharacterized protein (TIGR00369 family)